MGFILFIISFTLIILFLPLGFTYTLFTFNLKRLNDYYFKIALSIDQLGNVVMSGLFNKILINKQNNIFGNPDETISSVLGKNYKNANLTLLGYFIARILNKLDKNHVIKSIENDIN